MLLETQSNWHGDLVTALVALTAAAATVEFLGGRQLNRRVRNTLRIWFQQIKRMPRPALGEREARFALGLVQRIFGSRAFSLRRILTIAAGTGLVFLLTTVALNQTAFGAQYRHDAYVFVTRGALLLIVSAWLSIAITEQSLKRSIKYLSNRRWSNAAYATLLIFFILAPIYVTNAVQGAAVFVVNYFSGGETLSFGYVAYAFVLFFNMFVFALQTGSGSILETRFGGGMEVTAGTTMIVFGLLFWFRAALAFGSIAWWLSGFALRYLRLVIFRFLELKKGAITIFAGAIAGFAKFVDWLLYAGHL